MRYFKTILLTIIAFQLFDVIFTDVFISKYEKSTWNISEFLINYEGGYVRRGLLGQILLNLYDAFGISPYWSILLTSGVALGVFTLLYMKILRTLEISFFILLSSLLLANPIVNDFWIRKDLLIVLIFFALVWLAKKKKIIYHILYSSLFLVAISIHEAIGFLAFPILFLIAIEKYKSHKKDFSLLICNAIALFYFLSTILFFKGNTRVAAQIWNSWNHVRFPYDQNGLSAPQGAVDALGWDFFKGIRFFFNTLLNFRDGIYAPIFWLLIVAAILILLNNLDAFSTRKLHFSDTVKEEHLFYSTLQLLSVLPLFVLGWDYGRWIFYWTSSTIALYYLRPLSFTNFINLPTFLKPFYTKFADIRFSPDFLWLLLFLIGAPRYSWNMDMYTNSTLAYLTLNLPSEILKQVFESLFSLLGIGYK